MTERDDDILTAGTSVCTGARYALDAEDWKAWTPEEKAQHHKEMMGLLDLIDAKKNAIEQERKRRREQ